MTRYIVLGRYGDKSGGMLFGVFESISDAETLVRQLTSAHSPYDIELIEFTGIPVEIA